MNRSITKRDLLFFLLGIISMITIDLIMDWDGYKTSSKEGFEEGYQNGKE